MSSSARPSATARLPIDWLDFVAAPNELSAATDIMPTIMVEATTSISESAARCGPFGLLVDSHIDVVELRQANVLKYADIGIARAGGSIRRVNERALILVVDRQIYDVALWNDRESQLYEATGKLR